MTFKTGDKIVMATGKPSSDASIRHYLKAGSLATIIHIHSSFGLPYKYTVEAFGKDFVDTDKRTDSPNEIFSQFVYSKDIKTIQDITKPLYEVLKNGDLPNI